MNYDSVPLDSVSKIMGLGGLLSHYYRYQVITKKGKYYEKAVPKLKSGTINNCEENIVYEFSRMHPGTFNKRIPDPPRMLKVKKFDDIWSQVAVDSKVIGYVAKWDAVNQGHIRSNSLWVASVDRENIISADIEGRVLKEETLCSTRSKAITLLMK
jgi:hypothetical protein